MGLKKSKGRVETAKEQLRPLAESASHRVGPAVGQVKDHLGPAMDTAREKVSPYAEKAVERGATLAHAAVERAGPVIDDALSKVGPATEQAAEKARERFNDDVLPKVTAALASLAAAAEPMVEETSRRGKATKAALKGEIDAPSKKKSHKMRKVVLFLGFGALAAAAVKKLLTPPEPAWQSTPTSGRDYSSAPAGTTSRPAADKPAGTAPTAAAKPEAKPGAPADAKTGAAAGAKTGASAEAKAEPASSNGKTEVTDEAKGDSAKGTAKKTTTARKSTGTNASKPSDS